MSETTDRYWWHDAIVKDLRRLRDECDTAGYNVPGLAGNVRMSSYDVETYVAQLLEWGVVEPCEPLWDFPATWVRLAA